MSGRMMTVRDLIELLESQRSGMLYLTDLNQAAALEAERQGLVRLTKVTKPLGRGQVSRQFVRVLTEITKAKGGE